MSESSDTFFMDLFSCLHLWTVCLQSDARQTAIKVYKLQDMSASESAPELGPPSTPLSTRKKRPAALGCTFEFGGCDPFPSVMTPIKTLPVVPLGEPGDEPEEGGADAGTDRETIARRLSLEVDANSAGCDPMPSLDLRRTSELLDNPFEDPDFDPARVDKDIAFDDDEADAAVTRPEERTNQAVEKTS